MKSKLIILISILSLVLPVMLAACSPAGTATNTTGPANTTSTQPTATPNAAGEIEATEFQGIKLTPMDDQNNNALAGTQNIDRGT